MISFLKCAGVFLVLYISLSCNLPAINPYHQVVFSSGKAEIVLEDHLHHPFYWWPNTLLNYPVVFNEEVRVGGLILIDGKSGIFYRQI